MGTAKPGTRTNAEAAVRAAKAVQLRVLGFQLETIAQQCGYADKGSAYRAIQRELARTVQHPADELRVLEVRRLDDLLTVWMPKALKGDSWACRRCLDIMERRSMLLGLDAPKDVRLTAQVEVSVVPTGQARALALEILDALRDHPEARAVVARRLLSGGPATVEADPDDADGEVA